MPVVKLRFTALTVVAIKHVVISRNGIFGIACLIRFAALHITVVHAAVRYTAYVPCEPTRSAETVESLIELDYLDKLRKLAYIHVYEHRALRVEPDIQVVMPVLFVPTALPVGESFAHAAVEILLRFGNKDSFIWDIEMCLDERI